MHTPEDINKQVSTIIDAITDAIEEAVPWLQGCQYSVPGFNPECRELHRAAKQLKRWNSNYQTKYKQPAPTTS
jgi:hypothetical protein